MIDSMMINREVASTHNDEESSDYKSYCDAAEGDDVNADSNEEMKDTKGISYNDTVMKDSEEETKNDNDVKSMLNEKMLSINATKYACFNSPATADIKHLLSFFDALIACLQQ